MIIAYHAIFTTYGTWLPNDPRGSYSKTIYSAELAQLRAIAYGRQNPQPDRNTVRRFRVAALPRLLRPPYHITNEARCTIADALARVVARLHLSVPACAIMNDHIHLLAWRSKHTIEYLVNQFKGAATLALRIERTPWSKGCWKVFINDELSLRAAAKYVEANPGAAGLRAQQWGFVTPLPPDD
jgi:REP element-mobilizing transposase RayT